MFPHTITIYRHSIVNNVDTYTNQTISGVYWNESRGMTQSGNGMSNSRSVTVVTSQGLCRTFNNVWDIKCNDRIIKGVGERIDSFKDIPNSYVVTDVAINECGSDVDNITITGV